MSKPLKYAAKVSPVREVSLYGSADLSFWKTKIDDPRLSPTEVDGKAQMLVATADAKFFGIRFREISFSLMVNFAQDGNTYTGGYLIQAFNSVGPFAFVERAFFSTPYLSGRVEVETAMPFSVLLEKKGATLFHAQFGGTEREPLKEGEDGWKGPVFLPQHSSQKTKPRRWFYADVHGATKVYPFVKEQDKTTIQPFADAEIFQWLIDSQFEATQWFVREAASHAKSKTYQVTELAERLSGIETN